MSAISGREVTRPLIKLVIFAVVTIFATTLLGQTLGSVSFGAGTTYRARFSDVTGLLPGDDIRIAGVKVGSVDDITLVDRKVALVTFSVDDAIPLSTTVRAKIRYRNLVGQRYIALAEGPGDGKRLRENGVIPASQTEPALDLTVLFNGFRPLFTALSPEDINKFSYEIIQVLQGEAGTVTSLLQRTASLTNTLADRDLVIGRVITNLNQVLATLNARDQQLDQTLSQLTAFVSGLAGDRKAIGDSLQTIGDLADATASLVADARPALRQDIIQLRELSTTLNNNSRVIDKTLAQLPVRYTKLTRTASYGSWFNFFMCNFDGQVAVPGVGDVNASTFSSPAARCKAPGTAGGGQ